MIRGSGRPAEGGYLNKEGKRVPSVTTITGRAKDSSGMLYAAKQRWHEAGRLGKPFARDAYWQEEDALEVGGSVHQWIEDIIHGTPLTTFDLSPQDAEQANTGFTAFLGWRDSVKLEVLATEVPLVSEWYQYGGTPDAIALVSGKPALLDWKTSNASYVDMIAQVAAYRQLWFESPPEWPFTSDPPEVQDAYLLRVGKTYGDFHVHYWPSVILDKGWEWFMAARALYRLDKELKKVVS